MIGLPPRQVRKAIIIIAALCPIYIVSNFHRVSNAVIAPNLMADLTLSADAMGVLTGAFFAAYTLAQLPVGLMLDRIGARFTAPGLTLFAVLGAFAFAASDSMLELTASRVLLGAGSAGILMSTMVLASRWFPPEYFATVAGSMAAFGVFGNLLATTPFAVAVDAVGWRDVFVAMAVIGAVAAVIGYLIVRDAPPGHAFHDRKRESAGDTLRGLREAVLNPRVPVMFFINFVGYSSTLTVQGLWGGPYLHDVHGLGITERGEILAIMTIALGVGYVAFGPLDRIFDSRKRVTMGGAIGTVTVLGLLALLPQPPLWLATALLAGLGFFNGYSITAIAHGRTIFPDRLVGRGLMVLSFAPFLGTTFMQMASGPIVGAFAGPDGVAAAAGYQWMFAFVAVNVAIALIFYSRTADSKPSLERVEKTT